MKKKGLDNIGLQTPKKKLSMCFCYNLMVNMMKVRYIFATKKCPCTFLKD